MNFSIFPALSSLFPNSDFNFFQAKNEQRIIFDVSDRMNRVKKNQNWLFNYLFYSSPSRLPLSVVERSLIFLRLRTREARRINIRKNRIFCFLWEAKNLIHFEPIAFSCNHVLRLSVQIYHYWRHWWESRFKDAIHRIHRNEACIRFGAADPEICSSKLLLKKFSCVLPFGEINCVLLGLVDGLWTNLLSSVDVLDRILFYRCSIRSVFM